MSIRVGFEHSSDFILIYCQIPQILSYIRVSRCRHLIFMIYYAQISRAVPLRSWEASDGSLRNFTGKTQKKGNCPQSSFASFGASFRALSGASSDASEEVSFSAPTDVWKRAQAPRRTRLVILLAGCRAENSARSKLRLQDGRVHVQLPAMRTVGGSR